MNLKKSLTMTMPFFKIETNDSFEGVMGVPTNNHQLSLIALLLSINHGKGGDSLRKGGLANKRFCFSAVKGSQPWAERKQG